MKVLWLTTALVLSACGGPTTPGPVRPPASVESVLEIGELRFFQGDTMGLHLHRDGRLAARSIKQIWEDVATLAADGTVRFGAREGHLAPDGSFRLADGRVPLFLLDGGVLIIRDKRVSIDDHGVVLTNGRPGEPTIRIDGATSLKIRRTALLILALVLGGSDVGPVWTMDNDRSFRRALTVMAQFKDRLCACTDRACVERVNLDMTRTSTPWTQPSRREPEQPTIDEMREFGELTAAMRQCALTGQPP